MTKSALEKIGIGAAGFALLYLLYKIITYFTSK